MYIESNELVKCFYNYYHMKIKISAHFKNIANDFFGLFSIIFFWKVKVKKITKSYDTFV